MKKNKFIIYTYGCDANCHDSEKIVGYLQQAGLQITGVLAEANIIIVNSCAIRHTAENKVWGLLDNLKKQKQVRSVLIVLAGCMPPAHKEKIDKAYSWIDIVVRPQQYHVLPNLIAANQQNGKALRPNIIDDSNEDYYQESIDFRLYHHGSSLSAFVEIMTGCDNYCSYCIVPQVRGRERSRPFASIIKEVIFLQEQGYQEIVLLGQNVNSYYDQVGQRNFCDLLESIARLEIPRIRFFTSHPKDVDMRLVELYDKYPNIARHIHLPLQSGCDTILTKMNRKYSVADYRLLKSHFDQIGGISCTTDIIVGFPGETNENFQETLLTINELAFDSAFTFKFSPRAKTVAAQLPNPIEDKEKSYRLEQLMQVQNQISLQKNMALIGTRQTILVEGISKKDKEKLTGKTSCNRIVNFAGGYELVGKLLEIDIVNAGTWALAGKLKGEDQK